MMPANPRRTGHVLLTAFVDMKRRKVDLSEFFKADSSTERLNSDVISVWSQVEWERERGRPLNLAVEERRRDEGANPIFLSERRKQAFVAGQGSELVLLI